MARTNKVGIDYFPLDVDFFNDEKIEFTSARFGTKGENIAIRLLCKIYRSGYYTQWNNDESALLAKRAGDGIAPALVSEVVRELVKRGFFDESLFNRFNILTSRGIQKRYFEATRRYISVDVFRDFLLVDVSKMENVNINEINVNTNTVNDDTNTQIEKEKEKEKKKKVKIILPFFSKNFLETWKILSAAPKWKNKSEHALQLCLNQLAKYDEDFAIILMENSIANNWQGVVYDTTDDQYKKYKNGSSKNKSNTGNDPDEIRKTGFGEFQ